MVQIKPAVISIAIAIGLSASSAYILTTSPDWQDVVAFGADRSGATDSYSAFAAAVAATLPNGGLVYIPPGRYRLDTRLTLPSNVQLRGDGIGVSTLVHGVANSLQVLYVPPTSSDVLIRDLSIDGNLTGGVNALNGQIAIDGLRTHISRVGIYDYHQMGIEDTGQHTWVNDCKIKGNPVGVSGRKSNWGIWYGSSGRGLRVTHCDLRDTFLGAILGYGDDVEVSSNLIENTHLDTNPGGGQVAFANTTTTCIISGNRILAGAGPTTSGIEMNADDVIISHNVIYAQTFLGIIIQDPAGQHTTISNNVIKGCLIGIGVNQNCLDFTLDGNTCHNNTFGVIISAGCDQFAILGNRLTGNTTNYLNATTPSATRQEGLNTF